VRRNKKNRKFVKETNKKDNNLYLEMAILNAIEHKKKKERKRN